MLTLLVMCPKCGNKQKTQPKNVLSSSKKCVYCGKSFVLHSATKDRIVQRINIHK